MPTVVLLHGQLGFRRILWWEYFRGVRPTLQAMGLRVLVTQVPWAGSIKRRAASLARQLAGEAGPLHLIAHSMGGLDARYYITRLGGGGKVATLTTLATPHRGSAAADYVLRGLSIFRLLPSVRDLTPAALEAFNRDTPDCAQVIYRSYSAARPLAEQPWLVRRYGRYIEAREGANDSQVSIASAQWGEHVATLHADHFELIGLNLWLNPFRRRRHFDHLAVYRNIACHISS